jgi:hypothetical protein
MADRGIIFSGPMVRSLLDDSKSQTRRLASSPLRKVAVGDRLYVREAWHVRSRFSDVVEIGYRASERRSHTEYVAQVPNEMAVPGKGKWPEFPKYGPSIHMPRWASRLTLIVTEVRKRPLCPISIHDIRAEGVRDLDGTGHGKAWVALWNGLHTKPGERWEDNPEIVALTFSVHHCNIDRMPA